MSDVAVGVGTVINLAFIISAALEVLLVELDELLDAERDRGHAVLYGLHGDEAGILGEQRA